MLTHTRIGLPVSFATFSASSKVRCQWTSTGFCQSSAVGAGHIVSTLAPAGRLGGEPYFIASLEGSAPWAWAVAIDGRIASEERNARRLAVPRVRVIAGAEAGEEQRLTPPPPSVSLSISLSRCARDPCARSTSRAAAFRAGPARRRNAGARNVSFAPSTAPLRPPQRDHDEQGNLDRRRRCRGARQQGAPTGRPREADGRALVPRRELRGDLERVQPRGRTARGGEARRRVRRLSLALLQVPPRDRRGRARVRGRSRAEARRQGREGARAGQRRGGDEAQQAAPRPAPTGARARATRRPAARARALDHEHGPGPSAHLDLRAPARRRARARTERGPRDAFPQAARARLPRLRGLLLEERRGLHLAVLDHADGPEGPDGPGLRGHRALGRRDPGGDADPLGRGELALPQDGRAHELRAEPDHDPRSRPDPRQGRRLHHHRRPGQRAGGGGRDAGLLRRDRLPFPALPVRGPQPRLVGRGHGEQRQERRGQRGAARGHARAARSRRRARAPPARDAPVCEQGPAGRPQGAPRTRACRLSQAEGGGRITDRRRRAARLVRAALWLAVPGGATIAYVTQPVACVGSRPPEMRVDPGELERHVNVLARDLVPRDAAHPENLRRAAEYVRERLAAHLSQAELRSYDVAGETHHNVVAFAGPASAERIVVGAHYDAAAPGIGADDNASGVAGLIELARLLARTELSSRVELVAFGLEEPPYFGTRSMGSFVHADGLRRDGARVRAMFSLEMIGYFSDERGSQSYPLPGLGLFYPSRGSFIAVVGCLGQARLVRRVKRAMREVMDVPVRSINAPRLLPGVDFSDHFNYWDAGFDAVMITDTAFYRNPHYHTAGDTPATLDYRRMASVVEGIHAAVLTLDGEAR